MLRRFNALATYQMQALDATLTKDFTHPILLKSLGLSTYNHSGFLKFSEKILKEVRLKDRRRRRSLREKYMFVP